MRHAAANGDAAELKLFSRVIHPLTPAYTKHTYTTCFVFVEALLKFVSSKLKSRPKSVYFIQNTGFFGALNTCGFNAGDQCCW